MPEARAPALEERVAPAIAAAELAVAAVRYTPMAADKLASWLVASGFAELVDGKLVPTPDGVDVGATLALR